MEKDFKQTLLAEIKNIAGMIGHSAVRAGAFVGQKAAEGYRSIDPDVMRYFARVPLVGYSLLVSRKEKVVPGAPDGYPPLIFIHGLGGNRGTFLLMASYLWLLGRKRGYKIHFEDCQTIEDMALALAEFIDNVKEVTGAEQVEIVAHSLGGVIARLAMHKHGIAPSVKTLITLGSPLRGTYAARYANTTILRDIRPDSDLIKMLDKIPWPEGVRGVNFWSRNDLLIVPGEFATVEGAEHIDLSPFTHLSYLISPKCWAEIGKVLTR